MGELASPSLAIRKRDSTVSSDTSLKRLSSSVDLKNPQFGSRKKSNPRKKNADIIEEV